MKRRIFKVGFSMALLAGFLVSAISTQAYPPFLRQAAKFGAKNCTFCHTQPQGGEGWNERGQWLIAQKEKRKADAIDVAWLSEYQEPATTDKWAEMDRFAEVMSQTFHPAEEGNLKPIRARAAEMAEKAQLWRDSTPPKILNVPIITGKLPQLAAEAKTLAEMVAQNAGDEEIKKTLTALHDRFHEIVGACNDEKKKQ